MKNQSIKRQPLFKMGEMVQIAKTNKKFKVEEIKWSKALGTYVYPSEHGHKKEADLVIIAGFQLITPKIYVYERNRDHTLVFKTKPANENQFLRRAPELDGLFNEQDI